jgi:hypothetical protein
MGETGIIAMFKPVIESTGVGAKGNTAVFVEQATLSHEFGHAVGLVGRAIAVVSDHHDAENGNHCSNSDCLMHVSNEGATAMKAFTQKLQDGGNRVLFGPACLADAREAAGLPPQAPANPPAGPPGPPGQQP